MGMMDLQFIHNSGLWHNLWLLVHDNDKQVDGNILKLI